MRGAGERVSGQCKPCFLCTVRGEGVSSESYTVNDADGHGYCDESESEQTVPIE